MTETAVETEAAEVEGHKFLPVPPAFGIGDLVKVQTPYDDVRQATVQEYFPLGAGRLPVEPRYRLSHKDGTGGYYTEAEITLVQRAAPVAASAEAAAPTAKKGRKGKAAVADAD